MNQWQPAKFRCSQCKSLLTGMFRTRWVMGLFATRDRLRAISSSSPTLETKTVKKSQAQQSRKLTVISNTFDSRTIMFHLPQLTSSSSASVARVRYLPARKSLEAASRSRTGPVTLNQASNSGSCSKLKESPSVATSRKTPSAMYLSTITHQRSWEVK